jgi:hypothetical protein
VGAIFELHGTEKWLGIVPCAGTHAYIEASGAPSVIGDIIARARPRARISVVALHRKPEPVDFLSLMAREITLTGSMAYPDDYRAMVRCSRGRPLAAITHRFPLARFEEAIDTARDARRVGKVIIERELRLARGARVGGRQQPLGARVACEAELHLVHHVARTRGPKRDRRNPSEPPAPG